MSMLKEASIESNQVWKAARKPRNGPIFEKRKLSRARYRKRIRDNEKSTSMSYSNDLHDALLEKNGSTFWKCWRSRFDKSNKCEEVEGYTDSNIVADKFAEHFSKLYTSTNTRRAEALYGDYNRLRENYYGLPLTNDYVFDTELISNIIAGLKRGKAAGLDSLTAEHFLHSHPILPCILVKLFNLFMMCKQVPAGFGHSYTVPIPKIKDCRTKAMTCDDFRGIAISSIMSKIFEHCIVERFSKFLETADNQFGFKKSLGCNHAIYTVRRAVDRFTSGSSTANLCAIDLSKALILIKLIITDCP
jgi:hypothetical protein